MLSVRPGDACSVAPALVCACDCVAAASGNLCKHALVPLLGRVRELKFQLAHAPEQQLNCVLAQVATLCGRAVAGAHQRRRGAACVAESYRDRVAPDLAAACGLQRALIVCHLAARAGLCSGSGYWLASYNTALDLHTHTRQATWWHATHPAHGALQRTFTTPRRPFRSTVSSALPATRDTQPDADLCLLAVQAEPSETRPAITDVTE